MLRFRDACGVLLLAALVIGIQGRSGAWTGDFTFDEDEPAHAVSSLMVRDYLAAGIGENPVGFAENYYLHYPKVAIGHWPPLFYAGEALWMLAAGRSRIAMLSFVGVCAFALLTSVFLWVRRDYGTLAGMISALALAAPVFMQTAMDSVAPNILLAALSFWAAVAFGEYLDRRRWRDAIIFASLGAIAVGVHGRGAALALLPLTALFLGPVRWTKFRIAALIAIAGVALAAPRLFPQLGSFHIAEVPRNFAMYFCRAGAAMGWPILMLAIVGAFFAIRAKSQRLLAMTALVSGAWIFHSVIVANWGDRYLVTAAPGIAALSGAGFQFLRERWSRVWTGAMIFLICPSWGWVAMPLVRKPDLGYHRLGDVPEGISLIAGSALHEGAFVSEMALRDGRLDRIVLRGSKVLASSTWTGREYRLQFSNREGVSGYLNAARVEMAVIEESSSQPHVRLLLDTLRSDPSRWSLSQIAGEPSGVVIFRRIGALPGGDPVIRIDMRRSLGRTIENK